MDINKIENEFGKYPLNGGKILNEILNLQIRSVAMTDVIFGILSKELSQEDYDIMIENINKRIQEINAEILPKLL